MLTQKENDIDIAFKNFEDDQPLVSVIITTKNEEKNIENCLVSIREQNYKNIEIIVVDNFSTDATQIIARNYTKNVVALGPERSAQRNHGMIDLAKGKYVIYIDADMILSPNLLKSCVEHMTSDESVVALHIPEIILGRGYFSRVRRFERQFYDGTVIDGARFFNKEKFSIVGGFDAELFKVGGGEDWDLDKKIKKLGSIEFLKSSKVDPCDSNWVLREFVMERGVSFDSHYSCVYHNEADFKLLPYLRKKLYYSIGFNGYINKWGKNDPDIRKQFGIAYRFFIVFVEQGKWRRILERLDLVIGMYFLRVLVGVTYLIRMSKKSL